jgi:hypothetical protein
MDRSLTKGVSGRMRMAFSPSAEVGLGIQELKGFHRCLGE